VPLDRVNDAQRLDRELWPNRQQSGIGPIERCVRELGGVQALVVGGVGAFAENSADVHTLVDGLVEAAIPRTSHHYLVDPSKAKGAAKALLYAAFSARQPGTLSQRSCSHASPSQALQRSSPRQAQTLQASPTKPGWRSTRRLLSRAPTPTTPRRAAAATGLP
jgi:hypothetical protein